MNMKFSIIVPSYNQAQFLTATLDSILLQEDVSLEVLVHDGGSDDGSVEILEKYSDRISWISQPDHGQTDAINRGMLAATGDIFAYLNSDDIYFPSTLARIAKFFKEKPDCQLVYGAASHLNSDGSHMEPYPTEDWNYDRLFETCFICQPATFWRRNLIEKIGVFDERLNYSMDYEYWLRAGKAADIRHLPGKPLAGSRLHADTKTLGHRVPVHREILRMVRSHARKPLDCYHWLRHLAALEAGELGFPASAVPAGQKIHAYHSARWRLAIAETLQIELDHKILAETSKLISP